MQIYRISNHIASFLAAEIGHHCISLPPTSEKRQTQQQDGTKDMSRAWREVESRRVWVWVWVLGSGLAMSLGSTSLPTMTYGHTYTGGEPMKGDESCSCLFSLF